jgi:microcystin-dependent protein
MSTDPFLSQIGIAAFGYAPRGWALCNGQLLPINQNQALFSLLGTTYGGNGQTNFALPDLRGRVPMHMGNSHTLGEKSGEESHTLSVNEIPQHTHIPQGSSNSPNASTPAGNFWASNTGASPYSGTANEAMAPTAIAAAGGNQPHFNMSPFLALNFCIALQGLFPSPN